VPRSFEPEFQGTGASPLKVPSSFSSLEETSLKKSSPELFEDDLESASCSVTFVTVKKFSDLEKSKTAPNCLPACRKYAIHGLKPNAFLVE
jgi:hypothetical protein